jgi:hypothetical protein
MLLPRGGTPLRTPAMPRKMRVASQPNIVTQHVGPLFAPNPFSDSQLIDRSNEEIRIAMERLSLEQRSMNSQSNDLRGRISNIETMVGTIVEKVTSAPPARGTSYSSRGKAPTRASRAKSTSQAPLAAAAGLLESLLAPQDEGTEHLGLKTLSGQGKRAKAVLQVCNICDVCFT